MCISSVRDILTEKDNAKWYQKLMSNGNAENGNKLKPCSCAQFAPGCKVAPGVQICTRGVFLAM